MKQIIGVITIFILASLRVGAQDFVFTPINVLNGLSDNQVRYILQLPDGRMVFKTSGNINVYDGASFKYIHQDPQHIFSLKGYDGFYRIYQSGDSILWIKDHHKLMCVDLRTEKYVDDLGNYFKKIGFRQNVDDVFLDSQQRLWVLTDSKLSLKDNALILDISGNKGVLQDVNADKDKLYLFYNTGTLVCYDLKSKSKQYSVAAYPAAQKFMFQRTSLVVKGKNGFYQLRNGSKGGFFFFDLQKRTWEKILETTYTLNTLVVDAKGTASISCATGIWIVDFLGAKKRYLPTIIKKDGSKLNTEISTLLYDKQGGLWLGTANQGLLYHHPNRYMFTQAGRSSFPKISVKDIIVQSFAEDEAGNIYLKCQSEIYRYNKSAKRNISLELVSISSIAPEILQQLDLRNQSAAYGTNHTVQFTDIRGWKWTGTADGLKVFDPKKRKERTFYTKDGLSNNFIQAMIQDRHHDLWVTTSYGINKLQIDPKSGKVHFTSFDSNSGTLEGEYTQGAAFESADGTLYFGGINGFSILEPNRPKPKKLPFSPVFTNLFLRGEKIELGVRYDGRIILNKCAPYSKSIELSHNQNFITFEYSALNYQNSSQTYFRYQLEGIDKQWRETFSSKGNDNLNTAGILTISYTNLPPGTYTLKVMASNNNLDWNGPVSALSLTIHAPWWKTTIAYFLFTTFALIIMFAIIYIYLRNVRKKLERTHKEEILLLRIRNLIDQQHNHQVEKEIGQPIADPDVKYPESNHNNPNKMDSAFITRAMALVEKNLDVPDYSVEQLSRDLHMDRTGLYRKLITLLDKSPSLFIRNIRLEKAAALILEGELNISEIADRVGFSSSSYLSKCFQEQYGCRPSEYAENVKKST